MSPAQIQTNCQVPFNCTPTNKLNFKGTYFPTLPAANVTEKQLATADSFVKTKNQDFSLLANVEAVVNNACFYDVENISVSGNVKKLTLPKDGLKIELYSKPSGLFSKEYTLEVISTEQPYSRWTICQKKDNIPKSRFAKLDNAISNIEAVSRNAHYYYSLDNIYY